MSSVVHLEGSERECDPSPSSHLSECIEPPSPIFERVDPYTLHVVSQLFPGQHGIRVLASLLRQATVKQLALPEFGLVDVCDVAIVTAQNLRLLSRAIGIAYDTLEKYIVVLDRLRLFYKKRFRRQVELYFPLGRYQPPAPDVLDTIQELRPQSQKYRYRPKVRGFAEQVKRRFLLLRPACSDEQNTSLPENQVDPQLPGLIVEDIRQILGQEVDFEIGSRLLIKIEGAVRYRCTRSQSRLLAQKDDSEPSRSKTESPSFSSKGDFAAPSPSEKYSQSRLSVPKGDSKSDAAPHESRLLMQKGDSKLGIHTSESPSFLQKGDFHSARSPHAASEGRLFEEKDASPHEKGDSDTVERAETMHNVNVILRKKIKQINVNVDEVADYLCILFGESPKKKGYYKHLYATMNCRSVDAWFGALIETVLALHRQRADAVGKPGGYFYKRCIALHREGISSQTRLLIQQYEHMSYHQMVDRVRQTLTRESSSSESLLTPAQTAQPHTAVQHVSHRRVAPVQPVRLVPHIPRVPGRSGMSRQDVKTVYNLVIAAVPGLRLQAFRQDDASYALLLDDGLRQSHQTWLYSVQECQDRLARMHHVRDLFQTPTAPEQ